MEEISLLFAIQAEQLLNEGSVDEAIELCSKGIELYPDYPSAYFLLANAYITKGDLLKAEETINKGLELFPTFELLNDLKNNFLLKQNFSDNSTKNAINSNIQEQTHNNKEVNNLTNSTPKEVSEKFKRKSFFVASDIAIIPGLEFFSLSSNKNYNITANHLEEIGDNIFPEFSLKSLFQKAGNSNDYFYSIKESVPIYTDKNDINEKNINLPLNSETLAEILISQKAYKEALHIYEQLAEQEPQKKDKYLKKINFLAEQLNNNSQE